MLRNFLKKLPHPHSLRWQSRVALGVLEALIVAGSLITIYALGVSSNATRQLTEERMRHMQEAEDMVQQTLLIDRDTEGLMTAKSPDEVQSRYGEIVRRMDALDEVVEKLSRSSADVSVLNLQHSAQMFRNAAIIVAELRAKEIQGSTSNSPATMLHFNDKVQLAAVDMIAAAQELSAHLASDYHDAVRRVADVSRRNERWVVLLCVASLIIAWQVSWYFTRRVLNRLQAVSDSLRQNRVAASASHLSVGGDDEISEMARAVEEFLRDCRRRGRIAH